MQKLIKKAEDLAQREQNAKLAVTKSELRTALPDDVSVEQIGTDIEIKGKRLSQELIDNSALRDVAFLLRAVR